MLKGIPSVLSPELPKVLMEMGHGDEIVIADGNFPGASIAKNLIRLDGHGAVEVLKAILQLFPLDTYEKSICLMEKAQDDKVETPIWDKYKVIVSKYTDDEVAYVERYKFYERAKKAYAIVMTGLCECYFEKRCSEVIKIFLKIKGGTKNGKIKACRRIPGNRYPSHH